MTRRPPAAPAHTAFLQRLAEFVDDPAKPLLAVKDVTATPLARLSLSAVGSRSGMAIVVRLNTSKLPPRQGDGLRVDRRHEDVLLLLPDVFPAIPPFAHVTHMRFLGTPHVLEGTRLCLYLDVSQEWHPSHTAVDFMHQLWQWFTEAVTGRFDERTALFHPVGGVLHRTPGMPTVVVREALPQKRPFCRMRLLVRTDSRLDLRTTGDSGLETLVVSLTGPMFRGAGRTFGALCSAVGRVGLPDPNGFGLLCKPSRRVVSPHADAFLITLAATAARTPRGTPVYFVLAVPSAPRPDAKRHLLCGRLPVAASDRLRDRVQAAGTLAIRLCELADQPVEWCPVSEERPEMTTRRDSRTPVRSLRGARVVVLGCGGLGSWMAEFVARAGAASIALCDAAPVTGGLLVRQNYVELDVGTSKAEALAVRLAALRDDLNVDVLPGMFALGSTIPSCDLLIDATVSRSVAAALSAAWTRARHAPLVACVATDRATATLGMLTLTRPGHGPDPETADAAAGQALREREDLEPFSCFWRAPEPWEELNPAPGCSIPTFHGSAADLAVIAGALTRLIGGNLAAPDLAGTHLVAMPHAGHTVGHTWLGLSASSVA